MSCGPVMERAIAEACGFIDAHFRERLSLSRIADQVGYSVYHFHRAFRDRIGMTLGEYIKALNAPIMRLFITDRSI